MVSAPTWKGSQNHSFLISEEETIMMIINLFFSYEFIILSRKTELSFSKVFLPVLNWGPNLATFKASTFFSCRRKDAHTFNTLLMKNWQQSSSVVGGIQKNCQKKQYKNCCYTSARKRQGKCAEHLSILVFLLLLITIKILLSFWQTSKG